MTRLAVLVFWLAASLHAQQAVGEEDRARFRAVDIFVDTLGAPLAAYQLEFIITNSTARIVGIEGGEAPVFRQPPYYDPKAMQQERVIIAAFTTESAENLPRGKTRVATIHLVCPDSREFQAQLKLQIAATLEGKKIAAEVGFKERKIQ